MFVERFFTSGIRGDGEAMSRWGWAMTCRIVARDLFPSIEHLSLTELYKNIPKLLKKQGILETRASTQESVKRNFWEKISIVLKKIYWKKYSLVILMWCHFEKFSVINYDWLDWVLYAVWRALLCPSMKLEYSVKFLL